MRKTLTIEQSAELIKRGVSAERASKRVTRQVADSRGREIEKLRLKRWKDCVPYEKTTMTNIHVGLMHFEHKEIFTLADLFALMPKDIEMDFPNADGGIDTEDCYLCTQWCINGYYADNHQWCVFYTPGFQVVGDFCAKELIDALYKCLIWAIDNNHVKLD